MEQVPVVFEDVTLHQATILPKTGEAGGSGCGAGVPPADLCC